VEWFFNAFSILDRTIRRHFRLIALIIAIMVSFLLALILGVLNPTLLPILLLAVTGLWMLVYIFSVFLRSSQSLPFPLIRAANELPKLFAREGRLIIRKKDHVTGGVFEEELTAWGGKRASLVVWSDTAIVLDKGGTVSRVLRRGKHFIDAGEALRAVVDLRTQSRATERGVRVMTRDGIVVEIGLSVTFQIERGSNPSYQDPYPALNDAIVRAVYNLSVTDGKQGKWDDMPLSMVTTRLRNVIAQYSLSELYEHNEEWAEVPRQHIARETVDRGTMLALRGMGIHLNEVSLGNIDFPDEKVREEVRSQWKRQREGEINQQVMPGVARAKADTVLTMVDLVTDKLGRSQSSGEVEIDEEASAERIAKEQAEAAQDQLGEQKSVRLREFLKVFDIVDQAVVLIPPADRAGTYAQGLQIVQREMMKLFERFGLQEVPGAGHPFDREVHHAVERDIASSLPHDTVSRVVQRGYYYQGQVLRRAQVWVSGRQSPSEDISSRGSAEGAPKGGA
jgi:molecular chaperone GrpE